MEEIWKRENSHHTDKESKIPHIHVDKIIYIQQIQKLVKFHYTSCHNNHSKDEHLIIHL